MAKRDKSRKRISRADRLFILKRDRYICGYCGKRKKSSSSQIDHIIPVKLGGHHGLENFVTACRSCNRIKWNFPPNHRNSPRLRFHSGKLVAKVTWLAKGKRFPKRIPIISHRRTSLQT